MAHLEYYNNIVGINDMIYDSHKNLLEKVTMELGCYDKFDELCEKLLDQPKLKAKVDKNAPKKSKTAFMLFCDQHRDQIIGDVKKENKKTKQKFNLGSVQKKLGEMWALLTPGELEKYNAFAEKDKERYQEEFENYQETIYGGIYQTK
jgi:hypothetical protein